MLADFPQILENIYVGNTLNIGNTDSTERWETMTFDGLSVFWDGNVSSGNGTSLVLPGDPINTRNNYLGAVVGVLGGAGIGQVRRVVGYARGPGGQSSWTVDRAWDVPLVGQGAAGASSVVLTGMRGAATFEANTYVNGTNFQFYGAAFNIRVAGNVFDHMNVSGSAVDAECAVCEGNGGVLLGWGKAYGQGFQPGMYFQAVNNSLTCSTKLISTACGAGSLPQGQEALTYGVVHRGNALYGTDHILGYAGGNSTLGRGCLCCWTPPCDAMNKPTLEVLAEANSLAPAQCYGETMAPLFLVNLSSTLQLYVPPEELAGAFLTRQVSENA